MKKKKDVVRCEWAQGSEMMAHYHDTEWGLPVRSDRQHYEFLVLEGAQAGLSWATILKRRKGYAKAFSNFDPKKVSKYTKAKINSLLKDDGIIRNRLKVESAVSNAKLFLDIQKEFGSFDKYAWQFVGGKQINRKRKGMGDIQATSPESDAFSKDLKKRGFKFVGSTVIYAHMQAVGMVNDHTVRCFRHKGCSRSA